MDKFVFRYNAFFVHEERLDEFLSKLQKAMETVVVGDPLLEETDVSALISKKDVERIDNWVQEAVKEGAKRFVWW
ncbi:aldehyde dehydrogenase family protein [Bacillus paranthracis]